MSIDGPAVYKLIERLVQLRDAELAFRARIEAIHREMHEQARRFSEEGQRVHDEVVALLKTLREMLGVAEPTEPTPIDTTDLFTQFNDLFKDFFTPKRAPAAP